MYKVSMIGSGSYISIIILVGLIILSIERILAFKKGRGGKKNNLISAIVVIAATMLIAVMLFVIPSTNKITIEKNTLTAKFATGFTKIEISSEDVINAKIIDWVTEKDYKPITRNIGTSTGSFKEGKFTLRNGEKALVYTNTSRVLFIQLNDKVLLLGPDNFDEFIEDFNKNIYLIE